MLFELCTGRRLFRGGSDTDTLKMITDGHYPRPAEVNPRIGPELDAVIVKALAPDRDERYQTARELQARPRGRRAQRADPGLESVALGEWMQMLFEERLAEQDAVLAESMAAAVEMPSKTPHEYHAPRHRAARARGARKSRRRW